MPGAVPGRPSARMPSPKVAPSTVRTGAPAGRSRSAAGSARAAATTRPRTGPAAPQPWNARGQRVRRARTRARRRRAHPSGTRPRRRGRGRPMGPAPRGPGRRGACRARAAGATPARHPRRAAASASVRASARGSPVERSPGAPSATCRRTAISDGGSASVKKGVPGRRATAMPRRSGTVAASSVRPRPAVATDAPSGASSGPVHAVPLARGAPQPPEEAGLGDEGVGVEQDDRIGRSGRAGALGNELAIASQVRGIEGCVRASGRAPRRARPVADRR